MQGILIKIKKYPFVIPFGVWLIVNCYSFYSKGIWVIGEATRYIPQSEALLEYKYFTDDAYILYSFPIVLMSISKYIDGHYYLFIGFQYVLSLTALYYLFLIIKQVNNHKIAIVSTAIYAFCLQVNEYNSYIYTDSLFISLCILALNFLLQFLALKKQQYLWFHFLLCILILFTRPTSIPIVLGFGATLFFYFLKKVSLITKISFASLLFLGILLLLNKIMALGAMFDFLLPFKDGRIICGIQTLIPDNVSIPKTTNPILGILQFIYQNPIYFLKTIFQKSIAFFGMYRPHYSAVHNFTNMMYFYPIFIYGIWGIRQLLKTQKFTGMALALPIIFTFITIIISCDDWGNRFILPLISFFIIGLAFKCKKWFEA